MNDNGLVRLMRKQHSDIVQSAINRGELGWRPQGASTRKPYKRGGIPAAPCPQNVKEAIDEWRAQKTFKQICKERGISLQQATYYLYKRDV